MVRRSIIVALTAIIMVIAGCGGSGGNDTAGTISGNLIAGPVKDATVTAYKLNANGTQGDEIGASDPTGEDGYYSISNPDYTGPVFIKAVGGTYTDEAKEEETNLDITLTAIAYIDTLTSTISITPLTCVAAQLMEKAISDNSINVTMSKSLIDEKNSLVAEQFGLMQISDNTSNSRLMLKPHRIAEQEFYIS